MSVLLPDDLSAIKEVIKDLKDDLGKRDDRLRDEISQIKTSLRSLEEKHTALAIANADARTSSAKEAAALQEKLLIEAASLREKLLITQTQATIKTERIDTKVILMWAIMGIGIAAIVKQAVDAFFKH